MAGKTFVVNYIAYSPKDSSEVLSQGEMTVQAVTSIMAENLVKSMFGGGRVIIQGVFDK